MCRFESRQSRFFRVNLPSNSRQRRKEKPQQIATVGAFQPKNYLATQKSLFSRQFAKKQQTTQKPGNASKSPSNFTKMIFPTHLSFFSRANCQAAADNAKRRNPSKSQQSSLSNSNTKSFFPGQPAQQQQAPQKKGRNPSNSQQSPLSNTKHHLFPQTLCPHPI